MSGIYLMYKPVIVRKYKRSSTAEGVIHKHAAALLPRSQFGLCVFNSSSCWLTLWPYLGRSADGDPQPPTDYPVSSYHTAASSLLREIFLSMA